MKSYLSLFYLLLLLLLLLHLHLFVGMPWSCTLLPLDRALDITLNWLKFQAPVNMKSVLQAAWLLTVSFGNLLVVFITNYIKFEKQVTCMHFIIYFMFCLLSYFSIFASQKLKRKDVK